MKHFLQHLKTKDTRSIRDCNAVWRGIPYLYRIQECCQRQTEILLAGTE